MGTTTKEKKRLSAALATHKTIQDKCTYLSSYAQECASNSVQLREFHSFLPSLLAQIFGLDLSNKRANWFAEASGKPDIDALYQLLCPSSVFFEHLLQSVDENLSVAVSVSVIPVPAQKLIESQELGERSPFFRSKVSQQHQQQQGTPSAAISTIPLNLFEYYLVSFAFMGTRGSQEQQQLYQRLFGQYLQWFFPSSGSAAGLAAPIGARTRPALLSPYKGHPPTPVTPTTPFSATPTRATASPELSQNRRRRLAKPFLQIFIEMWLTHNSPPDAGQRQGYSMPTSLMLNGISALVRHLVSAAVNASVPLSATSFYAGGTPAALYSPYAYRDRSPGYERAPAEAPVAMTESLQLLQKPLWTFLYTAILDWPVGSVTPFSSVVEVWLAYIVPWDMTAMPSEDFTKKWKAFIFSNLSFYTHLFYELLLSAPRIFDFLNSADIRLFARVVATLSNTQLLGILKEGEETVARLQQSVISTSGQAQQFENRLRQHCTLIWGRLNRFSPVLYMPPTSSAEELDAKDQRRVPVVALVQSLLEVHDGLVEQVPAGKDGQPDGDLGLKTCVQKTIEKLMAIFEIENLPQRVPHPATPLALRRHILAAKKWSPLDARFMPRGIGNNLEEDIPRPLSSYELAPLVSAVEAFHQRFLKGTSVGDAGPLDIRRLRLLASWPFLAVELILIVVGCIGYFLPGGFLLFILLVAALCCLVLFGPESTK